MSTGISLTVGARQYPLIDRASDAELAAIPATDRVVALAIVDDVSQRLRRLDRPISAASSTPFFGREDLQ